MGSAGHFTIRKFLYLCVRIVKEKSPANPMSLLKKSDFLAVIFISALLLFTVNRFSSHTNNLVSFDLDSVIARGSLIALTDNNSTNYFIYRGEPMGFHYEILKVFTDHLGVDLEITTENDPEKALEMLMTGKADVLAIGLSENSAGSKKLKLTEPIYETPQVLIQRKPEEWRSMPYDTLENKLIRKLPDLGRKVVYVQEGSSHASWLRALSKEIGKRIKVREVPYDPEKLIRLVAEGEVDLAVCDKNVAMVNSTYYPDIDVGTQVNSPQELAWGVRKNHSWDLIHELNQWISFFRTTKTYALLYDKYFENSRSSTIVKSDYYALSTGKISPYDELIKIYSDSISWDWRLLASLICQESRFEPNVKSWAGAYGLMQVMPETGRNFGINITSSPGNNIKAGTLYIEWLQRIFDPRIQDENERYKFILASYNAGPGHILDAMRLAEKNGKDPSVWNGNVADWLLKKSDPQYYNDTVVKNGYFRGTESVAFVDEILRRYEHYKNIVPNENQPLSFSPRIGK